MMKNILKIILLNDDIILKNIKLYNEQYLSDRLWASKVREDRVIRKIREEWISIIIRSTDELEFTFDTCEIAIQFMDIFMEMKMKGGRDTSSYELFFMREEIHKWIEKKRRTCFIFIDYYIIIWKISRITKNVQYFDKGYR